MPLLNIGTDELPLPGSIEFSRATVYRALKEYARSLRKYGFRNLMITNGHGGLRHNLAIDDACRTCNRKYGMKMVSPCVRVYQDFIFGKRFHLVEEELGRKMTPVEKAGFTDLEHAGGWETSIMLAENAPLVARDYHTYHSSRITVGEKLRRLARILEKIILALPLFNRILKALDLSMEEGVRIMMTAVKLYDQKKTRFTYSGDPSVAKAAIGRAFEKAISREIVTLVETVYFGGTAKPSSIVSKYSLFFFLRRDFMRGALWTAAFLVIGVLLFLFRGAL
jgi:creatinine amidohydrolase/Fe(II)-dependent formamide hydrolase-like protein